MTYKEFAEGVSFKFFGPGSNLKGYGLLTKTLGAAGLSAEIINTSLPDDAYTLRVRLEELLAIPRMSTFAIGALINKAVEAMDGSSCFVNVGVWNGFSFLAGLKDHPDKRCIGVDNFSQFGGPRDQFLERFAKYKGPNHFFYDMDYRDYFATKHRGQIGYYIYDGEHSYENQLAGLRMAEPFFAPRCIVSVDDTNWAEPRQATLEFMKSSRFRYELLLDRTTFQNHHPTFWNGLMVFQRVE